MAFATPTAGLVIRYSFLWREEAARGIEEGAKDRPCAVILVTEDDPDGPVVTVLPDGWDRYRAQPWMQGW